MKSCLLLRSGSYSMADFAPNMWNSFYIHYLIKSALILNYINCFFSIVISNLFRIYFLWIQFLNCSLDFLIASAIFAVYLYKFMSIFTSTLLSYSFSLESFCALTFLKSFFSLNFSILLLSIFSYLQLLLFNFLQHGISTQQ